MHAAVVCGIGAFGASVARRVELDAAGSPGIAALTPDPAQAIEAVVQASRRLLAHERMIRARDAPGDDGPTELLVLVVAHLGEPAARDALPAVIAGVEDRLLAELAPIFRSFRGAHHVTVAPLIAMPHPHGRPDGEEIAERVRSLSRAIAERPASRRCTPHLWLIEDVAEHSILSEGELAQNARNFALVLLFARDALGERALHDPGADAPLATFACAVAELPRARLARWAANHVALELVDAVVSVPLERAELHEIDAVEDVELSALDPTEDAAHVVRDLLARYAPPVDPDAPPRWSETAEAIRDRYGPDHGDPGLDEAQPPPEQPVGFALERMRGIEDAWRLLQRRRFDDLVARERSDTEAAREALLRRIADRVDRELWSSPSPEAFGRTGEIVAKLRRGVTARLEDAIAERDAIAVDRAPGFDELRARHAELLDAARRKPDLGAMALWGGLALAAVVSLVPSLLVELADALDAQPTDWYEPWLRARALWTAAGAGLLGISGFLALRVWRAHRGVVAAHRAMWDAIGRTIHGASRSVATYFTSRLQLARLTARVQALLAVRAALDRDAESLELTHRAARRARAELLADQRALGASQDGGLGDLLAGRDETLVDGLVGRSAERAILRHLPSDARRTRIVDVLRSLADREQWSARWREEIPFSSIQSLLAGTGPHAAGIAGWDPLAEGDDAEQTASHLAGFFRRQARSLRVALDLRGPEVGTPSVVSEGIAIVPGAALQDVARRLETEPAAGAPIRCVRGAQPDRAYWLVAITHIAIARVASLAPSSTDGGRARAELAEEKA